MQMQSCCTIFCLTLMNILLNLTCFLYVQPNYSVCSPSACPRRAPVFATQECTVYQSCPHPCTVLSQLQPIRPSLSRGTSQLGGLTGPGGGKWRHAPKGTAAVPHASAPLPQAVSPGQQVLAGAPTTPPHPQKTSLCKRFHPHQKWCSYQCDSQGTSRVQKNVVPLV